MMLAWFAGLFFLFQQEIPFKPNSEFEIKLQYEFKLRPAGDISTVNFNESQKERSGRVSGVMLPYLTLNVKVLLPTTEEERCKVVRNLDNVSFNRKIEVGKEFQIDMGFTDDMKDRIKPYEYTVFFLSDKKEKISRIVIFVDKDGSFLVNGEKRGKL